MIVNEQKGSFGMFSQVGKINRGLNFNIFKKSEGEDPYLASKLIKERKVILLEYFFISYFIMIKLWTFSTQVLILNQRNQNLFQKMVILYYNYK